MIFTLCFTSKWILSFRFRVRQSHQPTIHRNLVDIMHYTRAKFQSLTHLTQHVFPHLNLYHKARVWNQGQMLFHTQLTCLHLMQHPRYRNEWLFKLRFMSCIALPNSIIIGTSNSTPSIQSLESVVFGDICWTIVLLMLIL